jgi:hypothetical protein
MARSGVHAETSGAGGVARQRAGASPVRRGLLSFAPADRSNPPAERDHYGNREFAIRDIDGYILAFAHSIAAKRRRG